MELMPKPMALPGCCFKCRTGSENREFFIDFKFSIDDFGAVIICNACLEEMAHAAGYITPVEARQLKEQLERLIEERDKLATEVFGLEQAIDGLRIAGRSVRTDPEFDDVGPSLTNNQELPFGTGVMETGEGISPESVHDEGMAVLPDDASEPSKSDFTFEL